ncbi:MAG: 2-oxo acid dehydrogenase subunit E2, partial [Chloroflexi bacterium]
DEVWQPLTAMRRLIAQHMVQSKRISPHVTTVFEVDMSAVVQHREAHKAEFAAKGLRLTYTPYFVAAAAQALRAVPEMNARFQEEGEQSGIVMIRRVHIGVAVALAQGLVVPVIRDADERNLQGLARAVGELADQARAGTLAPDTLHGGTFTITNHGVSGSLIGTPILNQPQAGILGIGAIVKRPVVRSGNDSLLPSADDALVIRPMCYLSLSFDHRVLDGAHADAFLTQVKQRLESWPAE